jgi:hypothetical protein
VLLPVNPADRESLTPTNRLTVDLLNRVLQQFARRHPDVYFFDVATYLKDLHLPGVFIDRCCHLSSFGALSQANFLFDRMQATGLLSERARNAIQQSPQ